MKRWAALLRGVNLGGRKLLSADLKARAEGIGYTRVETLLASGNVVFDSEDAGSEIERRLEAALLAHGLKTDIMVRDLAEMRAVIAANPFPEAALDHPSHMLVTFHRDPFPVEALARLEPGPERLHAIGRELYVDYLSQQGMRDSKLLQTMNKAKFPKVATGRNWNTVNKLAELLSA
ncbi:MAG: DUF1697 domain-containing protein [Sphingomonadales bacterium]|nr:MAG: DUF1697 domain-containing protein [Sphingomonadales bacterium]